MRDRVEAGKQLLRLLQENNFPVDAAYWLYDPEADVWKLVIASERAFHRYRDSYRDIAIWMSTSEILDSQAWLDEIRLEDINLVKPTDKVSVAISRLAENSSRPLFHLRGTLVDGQYIDEAIVYKLPV